MGNKVRVVIVDSDQGESKDSSKRVSCVYNRGLNGCSEALQFIDKALLLLSVDFIRDKA